ncbi:MAG: hypothetical protein Q9170_007628 [Blastenia crenularia]
MYPPLPCGLLTSRFHSIAYLFFVLVLHLHLVCARSVTATSLGSASLGTSHYSCVELETWTAADFLKEDCYVAVQDLYKWDFRWRPDEAFTFFSGSSSRHTAMTIQTPKRYMECASTPISVQLCQRDFSDDGGWVMVIASCTLTLVTLNKLTSYDLPGHLPHGEQPVDKATFREIYQATRALEEECIAPSGHPGKVGWAVVGELLGFLLVVVGVGMVVLMGMGL